MARALTAILVAVLAATAGAAEDVDRALARADRAAAVRVAILARRAENAGLKATARRLYERAIELDGESPTARSRLGYRRRRGTWHRDPAVSAEVRTWKDEGSDSAEFYEKKASAEEERRATAIVRVLRSADATPSRRDVLLALLDRVPRCEAVHEALGHVKIGGNRVRPELVEAVRGKAAREAAWAECRDLVSEVRLLEETAEIPGVPEALPLVRVVRRTVGARYSERANRRLAMLTEATRALLRAVLGDEAPLWDPPVVHFLSPGEYRLRIFADQGDPETRDRCLRVLTYWRPDVYTFCSTSVLQASDLYAHGAAYFTIELLATPALDDGSLRAEDVPGNGWLKEGFGYFASLELLDSARTWFVDDKESTGKIDRPALPRDERTRATCLTWVRAHLVEGTAVPLSEVCGRSLNNLDLLASMEAWTFVRFLAHYRPEGLKRLPEEIRNRPERSYFARADAALRKTCGAGVAELEPLWKAFTLEID